MIHPRTALRYISDEVGYGVVATEFIPAGTITWVFDKLDQVISEKEFEKMETIYQHVLDIYSYRNGRGDYVLCWDNGRFVNHSFRSTCLTTAYDFEIAIRDIHPGEELTDDYGYLNISKPFRGKDEGTRRKTVYPDDLLKHYKEWDRKLLAVFPKIVTVAQPLRELITPSLWKKVIEIAEGRKNMKSLKSLYFHDGGRRLEAMSVS